MSDCRCSILRRKHGGHKDGHFEMHDPCGVTFVASRNSWSHSHDLFMHSSSHGTLLSGNMS